MYKEIKKRKSVVGFSKFDAIKMKFRRRAEKHVVI